jgi:hypothetical protein
MRSYYSRATRQQRNTTFDSLEDMEKFFERNPKFELIEYTDFGDEFIAYYTAP